GDDPGRAVHRHHGAVRLREVHPVALHGRAGAAHVRAGADRRRRRLVARRAGAHPAPPGPPRLRVPGVQPGADAERAGEHPAPGPACPPYRGPRLARPGGGDGTARRPAGPPAERAVRRRAAAGGGRPGPGDPARGHLRRRAHRQPRRPHRGGRARAAAGRGRAGRRRGGDGHPRPRGRLLRRSGDVPRRRPDPGRAAGPHRGRGGGAAAAAGAGGRARGRRPAVIRLALGELRARPARLLATLLSVALGVGFVTGSLVLVDSVRAAFDDRYVDGGRGAAGVVRPAGGLRTQRYARVPGRVAAAVAAAPGVAAVAPVHRETVLLARPDGERLEPRGGGSRLDRAGLYLGNWIADPHLRDQTLRAGRPPATAAEAAIHRHTAAAYGLGVGDRVRLVLPAAAFQATITGVFDYGDADPAPNAPLFTPGVLVTTEAAAGRLGDPVELRVSAAPGVSAERLRGAVAAAVGDRDYEIVPAETAARDTFELIWRMNLGPLATGMSVFAGITVLAAGLIVYTTFAVTVAQRTRRYALLRLIGAGRGQ